MAKGKRKMSVADVAIVGAGVVGCAMARRFALEGANVVLLERGADLLSGASAALSITPAILPRTPKSGDTAASG